MFRRYRPPVEPCGRSATFLPVNRQQVQGSPGVSGSTGRALRTGEPRVLRATDHRLSVGGDAGRLADPWLPWVTPEHSGVVLAGPRGGLADGAQRQ